MWRMLQQPNPSDFVIATGNTHKLGNFVEATFSHLGLDWREHVSTDPSLLRPSDILVSSANPAKAKETLGWAAKYTMSDVVHIMIADEPYTTLSPP
jgi:GDPmannose 4,6-dehydratase